MTKNRSARGSVDQALEMGENLKLHMHQADDEVQMDPEFLLELHDGDEALVRLPSATGKADIDLLDNVGHMPIPC